ncbi:MAG: hypothetical protein HZA16_01560 [Nitrospirae bacterium]|nr:hypothetical protein [Nitrospirota bacterium]
MNIIKLLPAVLGMLLLAAHFFRAGHTALVFASAAILLLLFVRRRWAARAVQTGLVLGGVEWTRTLFVLAKMRHDTGGPWIRLVVVLGAVALFTICSTLVFRFKSLRERYDLM